MINSKRKVILIIIGVLILLIGLVGITYSFFNYTRTGALNNLGTGRIYFNSEQNGSINMTNVFPMTSSEAINANLDSVTIAITGDTTYDNGEEFEISIVDVNNTVNGKKVPINYIATYEATTGNSIGEESNDYWNARNSKNADIYTLTENGKVEEGEQVLVGFIKNSATGINGTLTIKAYIDADRIAITDTPDENIEWQQGREVFSTTEWNSLSSSPVSFKIRAESNEGIWVKRREISPDLLNTKLVPIGTYNSNRTSTDITNCVNFLTDIWGNGSALPGETYSDYCSGTGTWNGYTFQEVLDAHGFDDYLQDLAAINIVNIDSVGIKITWFKSDGTTDVVIPSSIEKIAATYNENRTNEDVVNCVNYLENIWGPEENGVTVTSPETYEKFCRGEGTNRGSSFQNLIDDGSFTNQQIEDLASINIVTITSRDTYPVISIGSEAFSMRGLTSIVIPDSVTYIGYKAFAKNQLSSVVIPDSVTAISGNAFSDNLLTSIVIGRNVAIIDDYAFTEGTGGYIDNHNALTSVTIKGKSSLSDFSYLGASVFGWAEGYSDSDIVFEN